MNHAGAETVVTFKLLLLEVRLDTGAVWEKNFRDFTGVSTFHDLVFAHQSVSTTKANDCLSTSLNWIIDLSNWHKSFLGDESDASSLVIWSFLLEDIGSVWHNDQVALINILDVKHTILSDLESSVGLWINLGLDIELVHLIRDHTIFNSSDSLYTNRVDSLPFTSSVV